MRCRGVPRRDAVRYVRRAMTFWHCQELPTFPEWQRLFREYLGAVGARVALIADEALDSAASTVAS
jgi:hypothetical protein